MAIDKVEKRQKSRFRKDIFWQLFLIILPWLVFWAQDKILPSLLSLNIFLAVGIIIAWKRKFPVWSYTWIGMLYFFVYREIFQIVIECAAKISSSNPELVINGFYFVVNPLLLGFLLALITRKDWLLACLTAYPYTSVIQAWYTLDETPLHIIITSLGLYSFFALLFLTSQSRTMKFVSLLAGTLVVGGGFFIYRWDLLMGGTKGFIYIIGRNLVILLFPFIIHKTRLYRKLFKTFTCK